MPDTPHFTDNTVAVILMMTEWSSSSAESIALQHPTSVVVEVSGTSQIAVMERIAQLSRLGVRVVALVDADPELEELCIRAGATPVVREDRPIHEIVEIAEIVDLVARAGGSHRPRTTVRKPPHRRAHDLEPSAESLAALAQLTRQEQNVLAALMEGQAVREIASSNVISPLTVRSHVRSILMKLGVNSQLAAVALAHRSGWRPDTLAGSGRR
jgi:two-component system, NarL family, nitrate/nitrite response regulator NarL